MSFWKSLFGLGGEKAPEMARVDAEEEFEGYTIKAKLMKDDGEYRIAGTIERVVGGELKTQSFIRADKFADKETASSMTLAKGRQIIKEQGDRVFE